MKRLYSTWNKENVDDEVIVEHLAELSKKKLLIDIAKVKAERLFDTVGGVVADSRIPSSSSSQSRSSNNSRRSNTNGNGYSNNNGGNSSNRYQQNKPRRRN
jgi:hypothetical protein